MSPAAGRRPLTLLWGERHHPDLDAARRLRGGAPKRKRAEDVVDLTDDNYNGAGAAETPLVDLTGHNEPSACVRAFAEMKWRARDQYQEFNEAPPPQAWGGVEAAIRARRRHAEDCDCILTLRDDEYPCRTCRDHAEAIGREVRKHLVVRPRSALAQALERTQAAQLLEEEDIVDNLRAAFTRQHAWDHRMESQTTMQEALAFCAALREYRRRPRSRRRFWVLMAALRPAKWARARAMDCIDQRGVPRERCLQRDIRGRTELDRLRVFINTELQNPTPTHSDNILLYFLLDSEYPLQDPPPANLLPASVQWGSWNVTPDDDEHNHVLRIREAGRASAAPR